MGGENRKKVAPAQKSTFIPAAPFDVSMNCNQSKCVTRGGKCRKEKEVWITEGHGLKNETRTRNPSNVARESCQNPRERYKLREKKKI